MSLWFGSKRPKLIHYIVTNISRHIDFRKSTSRYLITFLKRAILWQSKLQKCVTLSTIEVEFMRDIEACKEMHRMKGFLQ